jgi:chitin-binding protein
VSWGASTDDIGIAQYEVLRNGEVIATLGPETTMISETDLPEGACTYQVRATDRGSCTSRAASGWT